MISALRKDLKNYKGINKRLDFTIDYLLSHDLNEFNEGKTDINEFLSVTKLIYKGKEKENATPEEHYYHYDMQLILKGKELCYFDFKNEDYKNHIKVDYNEEKDVIKYDIELKNKIIFDTSNFTLFMPNDVHQPSIKIDDEEIIKLVVKVLIN